MITIDTYDLVMEEYNDRESHLHLLSRGVPSREKCKITEYVDKHRNYEAFLRLCDHDSHYLASVYVESSSYAPMPKIRRVYTNEDKSILDPILLAATALWQKRIEEFMATGQHTGTCVLGAGFKAYTLTQGKRKPQKKLILRVPSLTQGATAWEESRAEIQAFLQSKDVDCEYEPGNMD